MRKLISIICLVAVMVSLTSCNAGKTNNVVISIGESKNFTKEEIQSAVNCVIRKFKDFSGCELTKLWYDDEASIQEVKSYMSSGMGAENGVKVENVIALLSDFYVDSSGGDGSFNPNSTYPNWKWILNRDSKTGDWYVADWGYA